VKGLRFGRQSSSQLPWLLGSSSWYPSVHIKFLNNLVGSFNPSEKYESQLGLSFPIYGKIKNVPNHQYRFSPLQ
jgi:hypothetical protein